jgi:hypothetical protein
MPPEKDKVALMMERNHLSTAELRSWWKERHKIASHGSTKHARKVVHHQLGRMIGRIAVILHPYSKDELLQRKYRLLVLTLQSERISVETPWSVHSRDE